MLLTALSFLKNFSVVDYVLMGCVLALLGWTASLKIENHSLNTTVEHQAKTIAKNDADILDLQTSLAQKRSEINLQNKIIEQNRIDKEAKDKEAEIKKEKIDQKYNLKKEEVKNYKGDANASSCDNARVFLNSVSW
jgi:predicted Holliday junction resolvase-like endonuclease